MFNKEGVVLEHMIQVESSIQDAIRAQKPVVAIESATIVNDDVPLQHCDEYIDSVEEVIRNEGAVPAFIAAVAGVVRVGVTPDILRSITVGEHRLKISMRDFPLMYMKKLNGGITTGAALFIAEKSGIEFFSTGAIGGVHRGVLQSFDISSDLSALEKFSVCTFSSGADHVLDIQKTIETIESKSIPVWGYQTDNFPEYFVRGRSPIDVRLESVEEIALLWRSAKKIGIKSSALVCVEPPEDLAIPAEEFSELQDKVLLHCIELGIRGKELTGFQTQRIAELTEGRSFDAIVGLLLNNARVAAKTAVAYANL